MKNRSKICGERSSINQEMLQVNVFWIDENFIKKSTEIFFENQTVNLGVLRIA